MKVTLEKTGISVEVCKEGKRGRKYSVEADTSYSTGGIHLTHEFYIHVKMVDNKLQFLGGDEIACEDIVYDKGEDGRGFFDYIHPGLLDDLEKYLQENTEI